MDYLDYYFERNSDFGSTNGVVNRKIKLVNIFYPNLIRSNAVLINSTTTFIRQDSIPAEIQQLTWANREYDLNSFVSHINDFIQDNFNDADLVLEIVDNERVQWRNTSQNVLWRILLPDLSHSSFFSPTLQNQLIINAGITTDSFIPDLTSGISNLEVRFSDNNLLQVPWVGNYLSQTVYTFPEPLEIHLKNANRVEIRATFGGADQFGTLVSPLRRVLRIGFIEIKE